MNKLLSCGLLALFILGLLVVPGSSQNADEILERVIKARGRREILEGIKDVTIVADMEIIQMGMEGTMTIYQKEPNMYRHDIEIMGMQNTIAFDGETAWWISSQTGMAEDFSEEKAEVLRHSSFGNSALLDPAKYGIKYTYKGKETIEGKDYLILDRVYSGGSTIIHYIDPETYLIYKTKQDSFDEMMTEIVEETIMSDYKNVEGVMTAHVLTILRDGTEFGILTVTDVDINTGLEDSFFKKEE
jgi:outer membrane lipoprotein-sorting protein